MNISAKRASTLFLKAALIVIALIATAIWFFSFPNVWNGLAVEWPMLNRSLFPGLFGIYSSIVPFLFALIQAFILLRYIDKNDAFSFGSIRALRNIKFAAVVMCVLLMCAMPLAFIVAELDDAPGLIIISFAFACAPLVVATFAAVLQKLVQNAIDIKSENDLTV
jgi:hypothetical protein